MSLYKHGAPCCWFFDEDAAVLSNIIHYVYKNLGIKIKTISPYNHGSLILEGFNKAISTVFAKWLIGEGKQWP